MRIADGWTDFEILDATCGERLERWGDIILIRPDPQVIWKTEKRSPLWRSAHARYRRSSSGGGSWERYKTVPEVWSISYKKLRFNLKPMGFKHTGLFPEQAANWDFFMSVNSARPPKILNLFAYTGGATVANLAAGAQVTHVDASKGMTAWAKENARASGLSEAPVRWIVDDCVKFVEREIRRGSKYDGIIMDPPSYGRGPGGEIWQLENEIYGFIQKCTRLLSDDARFFVISSYTAGLSPSVMEYILNSLPVFSGRGKIISDELGLPVKTGGILPCGATSYWRAENK